VKSQGVQEALAGRKFIRMLLEPKLMDIVRKITLIGIQILDVKKSILF